MSFKRAGHICVDLDGTLAHYDGYKGHAHIGEPIPKMALRVRRWLVAGKEVRIFTARANPEDPNSAAAVAAIKEWTTKHFGVELPVTCMKDYSTIELWDDRAVQVRPNTGERVDGVQDL